MKIMIFRIDLLITLIFSLLCFFIFSANAEVITVYEKDHWKVNVIKYDNGAKACAARVSTDKIVLQIYRSNDEYTLDTFYDDYRNKKLNFFTFRIDNNKPWRDNNPIYKDGWLMSNIFNYNENAAKKIENEMRAGRKFYQMDENNDIAWFSLIGSSEAFDFFDDCVARAGNY